MQTPYLTHFGWFPTPSCCCFTPYTNILLTVLLKPLLGLNCCCSPGGISFLPSPNFSSHGADLPLLQAKMLPISKTPCRPTSPLMPSSLHWVSDCPPCAALCLSVLLSSYLAHILIHSALGLLVLSPCIYLSHLASLSATAWLRVHIQRSLKHQLSLLRFLEKLILKEKLHAGILLLFLGITPVRDWE